MALTAPPVEDAANKALCEFIADQLGVAKRAVRLESGAKSRNKLLSVRGVSLKRVMDVLS